MNHQVRRLFTDPHDPLTEADPIRENPRIADPMCFLNQKVDLVVDGELQERTVTPWS